MSDRDLGLSLSEQPSVAAAARPKELPGIQILRFVAAMFVVLFHVGTGLFDSHNINNNIFRFGYVGVDIFFVISGFIISYTTDYSRGSYYFLSRRISRIGPIYWIFTAVFIIICLSVPAFVNNNVINLQNIIKSLLFVPFEKPNGAVQPLIFLGWTLCYEVYFYLIFALFMFKGRLTPNYAILALAIISITGAMFNFENILWKFYTNPIIMEFAFGIALHHIYRQSSDLFKFNLAIFIILICLSAILFWAFRDLPRLLSQGVPAFFMVFSFLTLQDIKGKMVAAFLILGNASYSLYLMHPYFVQLPIKVFDRHFESGVIVALVIFSVIISLICSVFSYRLLEKPAQSFMLSILLRKP